MVAAQAHSSQDDRDFCIGNLPEGLNVSVSDGPPTALSELDHLSLKQNVDQFGLAGKIWQSAYMLQSYFSPACRTTTTPAPPIPHEYYRDSNVANPTRIPTKPFRIVELGAGTGYVGIWLAKMLRQPSEIYITDLEQVLPLIRDNVAEHYRVCTDSAATVRVQRLHWGNRQDAENLLADGPIDLVVISDCVYFPELFDLLSTTLQDICSPTTKVVIGYKCRSLEKEAGFWQDHFGRFFEYEPVWKLVPADDSSDDGRGQGAGRSLVQGGMLGEEEQVFVFVGSKRPAGQIKAADDTFTTLLFCNIMDF